MAKSCGACKKDIAGQFVTRENTAYCSGCFKCATCSTALAGKPFVNHEGAFRCENCYYASVGKTCKQCNGLIKGEFINAMDNFWHDECFVCSHCMAPFDQNATTFSRFEDKPYCAGCSTKLFTHTCSKCLQPIIPGDEESYEAMGYRYHARCFVCHEGNHPMSKDIGQIYIRDDKVFCPEHFSSMYVLKCHECQKPVQDSYLKVADKAFHEQCWHCHHCKGGLDQGGRQHNGQFVCVGCFNKLPKSQSPGSPQSSRVSEAKMNANETGGTLRGRTLTFDDMSGILAENPERNSGCIATGLAFGIGCTDEDNVYRPVQCLSYAGLINKEYNRADIDVTRREMYLSDEDFLSLFQMPKKEFMALRKWKRIMKKKELNLF